MEQMKTDFIVKQLPDKHNEYFNKLINGRKGILFLDIDGCLNHEKFYYKRLSNLFREKDNITTRVNSEFADYSKELRESFINDANNIDYDSLSILNDFCVKNQLDVVISSTWKSGYSVSQFRDLFRFCLGLPRNSTEDFMTIIGKTPHTKERIRGVEIYCWLRDNIKVDYEGVSYIDYRKYLIIDDSMDMLLTQKNHFFKCCPCVGITPNYLLKLQEYIDSDNFNNIETFKKQSMITLIACVDSDMGIGFKNELLVKLKYDLQNFKAETVGKTILMGRKTLASMGFKILPNRKNVIATVNAKTELEYLKSENCEIVTDLEKYIIDWKQCSSEELVVIGGQEIYEQTILDADRLVITHLNHYYEECDKFFPEINPKEWRVNKKSDTIMEEVNDVRYSYKIVEYLRIK